MASTTLRTVAYGYIFYAWGMVMGQAFNGAGDTKTPTWLNLLCFWAFQIPLAWLLAFRMGLGVNGIFIAIPVAQSALAVAGVLMFRRGKWKGATV
jgi:Na+-driven multidrug efflux pump